MDFYRNKRILITGGLGFIGSNLAIKLVELGANVYIIDSLIPEYGGNLFNVVGIKDRVSINISDVRDAHSLRYFIRDKDVLFNLAGQTSHLDSMNDPFTDLEINAHAQLSILETAKTYNPSVKIVFASTRQIYGKPEYLPVDEKHHLKPVDVNGINKMAGEWYHILYNNVYNIRSCALRLTNTYGPRMRIKDDRQTFLGIWIKSIINKKKFEVWGGQQLRDFNHVNDVVDALLLSGCREEADGRIFNLGNDEVISLITTAKIICELFPETGYELKDYPIRRKLIDIGDYYSNYSLIESTLGWKPKTKFKEGIIDTVNYYRNYINEYL